MALWRYGSGWDEATMKRYLATHDKCPVNFDVPLDEITPENGWKFDGAESIVGQEEPGPPVPGGHFERGRQALLNYDFSDKAIVTGHWDADTDFVGRTMLLEIKVLGFHFLSGVRVHAVRDDSSESATVFGFRYDTIEGHIERGFEWFLLEKNHATGAITFRIQARWRLGEFPNWWSRVGFRLFGEHYREIWRRHALAYMTQLGN